MDVRGGFIHRDAADGDRLDDGGGTRVPGEGWLVFQDGGWDCLCHRVDVASLPLDP